MDVHGVHVQYFDTITPSVELNILRNEFLFAASEYSNHVLYSIKSIGDEEEKPIFTYSTDSKDKLVTFNPREPVNILAMDEL